MMQKPRKLIIQIPCYNESGTLGITLQSLPREVTGFDRVEFLLIDDGSTDDSLEIAEGFGVDHVIRFPHRQGLAAAFMAGLDACVRAGADVIVNTDADNQYCSEDISKLVEPILRGEAEVVVGARPIRSIAHFSWTKRLFQLVGSWVVRLASGTDVADAPSGFRAFTRHAAMRLHVFGEYTYTLETIIQAGQNRMAIVSVPIRTNSNLRPSRLVKSLPNYIFESSKTIFRIFVVYRPLRFFTFISLFFIFFGLIFIIRYIYLITIGEGAGHVQSVILSALLLSSGIFVGLVGVVADLISVNRKLLQKIDARLYALAIKDAPEFNPVKPSRDYRVADSKTAGQDDTKASL